MLKLDYENQFMGRELFLTCTLRSIQEQQEIFARNKPGEILTKCDGVRIFSKHNPLPGQQLSRAFDVGVKLGGVVVWGDMYFTPLGLCLDVLKYRDKIRWGGDFKSFKDYPHFEVI